LDGGGAMHLSADKGGVGDAISIEAAGIRSESSAVTLASPLSFPDNGGVQDGQAVIESEDTDAMKPCISLAVGANRNQLPMGMATSLSRACLNSNEMDEVNVSSLPPLPNLAPMLTRKKAKRSTVFLDNELSIHSAAFSSFRPLTLTVKQLRWQCFYFVVGCLVIGIGVIICVVDVSLDRILHTPEMLTSNRARYATGACTIFAGIPFTLAGVLANHAHPQIAIKSIGCCLFPLSSFTVFESVTVFISLFTDKFTARAQPCRILCYPIFSVGFCSVMYTFLIDETSWRISCCLIGSRFFMGFHLLWA